MSVRYCVDLQRLAEHAERVLAFAGELDRAAAHSERLAAALRPSWSGLAAEAHDLAHREWVRAAEELRAAVGCLGEVARDAHERYRLAVEAAAEPWSRWR